MNKVATYLFGKHMIDHGVKTLRPLITDEHFSMRGKLGCFIQEMLLIHQGRAKLNRQFSMIFEKLFILYMHAQLMYL